MCVNEFTFCFVHCANRITDNTHPFFKHFLDCRIVRTGSRVGVVPAWFAVPLMVISCRGNSLKIFDSTDLDPFGFKNRSLFDVQFNVFMRDDRAGLRVSRIANTLQLITQTCAISADSVRDFLSARSCIDERSHHIGLITDTLFVCECADSNRAGRFDPGFSESPDDSQSRTGHRNNHRKRRRLQRCQYGSQSSVAAFR